MSDPLLVFGTEMAVILPSLASACFYLLHSEKRQRVKESQRESQLIKDKMLRAFRREITSSYRYSQQDPVGKFRLLEFCSEAEVDAGAGKIFLQSQVVEFGGIVDVDDYGDISYYFGDAKVKFITENLEKD